MIINCDKQDCRQCRFHRCYLEMAINYEKKTTDGEERSMTREEAIQILEDIIETYRNDEENKDWVEACSYAINLIVMRWEQ